MKNKVLLIALVVSGVLFLARGVVAKTAVSAGVKAFTGLSLNVQKLDVGVFNSRLQIAGIRLSNPKGFPDPVMIDLPEIYVDYSLLGFFQGKTHLEEIRLNLKEFVVVKDKEGKLNLDALTPSKQAKAQKQTPEAKPKEKKEGKPGQFQIDKLHLKIGKVIYKDYSAGGEPSVREFNVNIDEQYENITNPAAFGSLILSRALFKTTVGSLANLDVGALQGQASVALKGAQEAGRQALDSATETLGETTEKLKGLFSMGQQE